jgi:lipoate-protein ligase B
MLCTVYQLGQVGYSEAYYLQTELLYQRLAGKIRDVLLLLEHPPTITIGKSGKLENIIASQIELAEKGVPVLFVDRGGDVTYHGPGQLVGYPIIDLRDRGRDLHRYVHDLEEVVIRTLSDFSIKASRDRTHRGVWVGNEEIAAIGLRVRKWVTMHGFALNVNTDLEPFSLINPCGFSDRGATSISALLSQDIPMAAVTESLLARFAEVFDAQIEPGLDILARNRTYENQTTTLV